MHENTGSVLDLILLGYEVLSLHDVHVRELEPAQLGTTPSIQVPQSEWGASWRLSESELPESELHVPEQTLEPVGLYFPGAQPPHSPHRLSVVLHHEVTV